MHTTRIRAPQSIAQYASQRTSAGWTAQSVSDDESAIDGTGVFELKWILPEAAVPELISCAREHLHPDSHSDPILGDGYEVHSLYFDDADLSTYRSIGPERLPKYRIRGYGDPASLFLERKSKPEGRVRKRRSAVVLDALTHLSNPDWPENWEGKWFHSQLRRRCLRPVCLISYLRIARVGEVEGQKVRFTLDRHLRCAPERDIVAPHLGVTDGHSINGTIAEIKFERDLPGPFATVIGRLGLEPCAFSKYKRAIESCGLNAGRREPWETNGCQR